MLSLLRGVFQRSAKAVKAKSSRKLLVYPGMIIGVSAATCLCVWKGNDYYIKKQEQEELELKAYRKEQMRNLRRAVFDFKFTDDENEEFYPIVFPPVNGRTVHQMVCDFVEEEKQQQQQHKEERD